MNFQFALNMLQDAGQGTIGVNLFRVSMPDSVSSGLLVVSQSPISINQYSKVRSGRFQVVARSQDPDLALTKAKSAAETLRVQGLELEGVRVYFMNPENEPLVYPKSQGGLFEASVNIEFSYSEIS